MTPSRATISAVRLGAGVVLMALLFGRVAQAQTPTTTLRASSAEVGVGLTSVVTIDVEDVYDLYGAEINVMFDPTVVRVVDAAPSQPGVQVRIGDFLEQGIVVLNQADNANGTVETAWTQVRPSEPKSGGGALLILEFEGIALGATSGITITDATLVDGNVAVVPLVLGHGSITVVGTSEAPATPTRAAEQQRAVTPIISPLAAATESHATSAQAGDNEGQTNAHQTSPAGAGAASQPESSSESDAARQTESGGNEGEAASTQDSLRGDTSQGQATAVQSPRPPGSSGDEAGAGASATGTSAASAGNEQVSATWTSPALGSVIEGTPAASGSSSTRENGNLVAIAVVVLAVGAVVGFVLMRLRRPT